MVTVIHQQGDKVFIFLFNVHTDKVNPTNLIVIIICNYSCTLFYNFCKISMCEIALFAPYSDTLVNIR